MYRIEECIVRPPVSLVECVVNAWKVVICETVKKCGISIKLDGKEVCSMRDDSTSEESKEESNAILSSSETEREN